jgi:tripartite-type tricarboxylate transporter receptor subunit TctC
MRSIVAGFLMTTAVLSLPTGVRADAVEDFYKGKTIYALVGVSPGGEYDFQLRLVARHIGKYIPGHPNVVAQNMTGATGMVMANYLYRVAPKDGTYIGLIQNGLPTSQAVGLEGVQFDAARYNWIGSISPTVETMAVWKTTGVQTIEDAKKTEVIAGCVGSSGITLTFPVMLNDLIGTKFKMVMGYTGSGPLNLAIERGEVSGRNNSWSSWKASKPEWVANKDINVLVYSGPKPADLDGVPAIEDLVSNDDDRQVVNIVTAGNALGHPFAMSPDVPKDRVAAIRKAFQDMMKDAEFIKEAEAAKLEIDPVSAATLEKAVLGALGASDKAKQRARKYFQ